MNSWLEFEGHRVWYRREGAGKPMLFLHNGADHHLWDYQIEHFRKTHEVITPDLLGASRYQIPTTIEGPPATFHSS